MKNELILPWPIGDAVAYLDECVLRAKESKIFIPESERVAIWIDFYKPSKKHYEEDEEDALFEKFNAVVRGIALALGIDDKRFRCYPYVKDQIGGMVKVRLTSMPEEDQ